MHFAIGKTAAISWAVAATAIAIATGGMALANGAAPDTEIHACVSDASGALRIAVRCSAGEHPLAWGEQGPAGARGRQGLPGARGYRGPTAAGDRAHSWTASIRDLGLSGSNSQLVVASPLLPGGDYIASADLTVAAGPTTTIVQCSLTVGSASDDEMLTVAGNGQGQLYLGTGGASRAGNAVTVDCQLAEGTIAFVQAAHLTVTGVGALN